MEVTIPVSDTPSFASTREALGMLHAVMGYLSADAGKMATEAQAECLLALEQLDAVKTATRARLLDAFNAGQGYAADADYSPRSWLIHRTRITKGAAAAHLAWVRRTAAHPRVAAALADGDVSESYARKICEWDDKLPRDCRDAADAILLAAARAGAQLTDLVELAAEIYTRSLPAPDPDDDRPDETFEDRRVTVETTFDGAGVLNGDLTPECAAVVTAVLESLSAPMGAEDTRSREQRYHDGLQEAMRRLVAGGLLPERAGQPVKAMVHVSLAELRAMDDSALEDQWITEVRARWAARRAAASEGGSDGAAWLDGDAARAATCDAALIPVVTGEVDLRVLDDLVRMCVQLDRLEHDASRPDPASPSAEALQQADHRQGRRPVVRAGRAGLASCGPGSWEPSWPGPACRWTSGTPRPSRPGSATPSYCATGGAGRRRLPPARRGLPGPPRQAQSQRRPHQPQGLCPAVLVPPFDRHPPVGLDPGPEPGRDHHRLEPRPHQGPA